MPFKSDKQRRFMYAEHPEIAKRWSKEEKAAKVGKKAIKALKEHGKHNK